MGGDPQAHYSPRDPLNTTKVARNIDTIKVRTAVGAEYIDVEGFDLGF